jgi:hypothetical protein
LNKNKDAQEILLNSYMSIVNNYVKQGYSVKLFSMCYNNIESESDVYLNNDIYNSITNNRQKIKIVDNENFFTEILSLKYSICERFHSHIFSLIYNIPFISFANTDKVKKLLNDIKLSKYLINHNTESYIILLKLIKIDKNTLKNIYKNIYKNVEKFYNNFNNHHINNILINDRHQLYLSTNIQEQYCKYIYDNYNNKTDFIMMNLFGHKNNDYRWGIENKIANNVFLMEDIKWLFEKSFLLSPFLFNQITNFINLPSLKLNYNINIDYIDQYDRTNVHRSGWKFVVDNLSSEICSYNNVKCDLYIDKTFHWDKQFMINNNVIPYKENWIGFIHHTLYNDEGGYNCINLFKCPEFIDSLKSCEGLIVLSKYLKQQIINLATVNNIILPKINVLYHPTMFVSEDNFWNPLLWKGEVIQIGSWMRDLSAIYKLKYKKKYVLVGKKMENKYISFTNNTNIPKYENNDYPVNIIEYLENDNYDLLLIKYIVFLYLYDASAVNTIIECIIRNTPIIINKLPAVVEYLGEKYPLYYTNIDDVPKIITNKDLIIKGHKYLKKMDKTFLKIETFIHKLNNILKNISYDV